jgi:hypothetical protein
VEKENCMKYHLTGLQKNRLILTNGCPSWMVSVGVWESLKGWKGVEWLGEQRRRLRNAKTTDFMPICGFWQQIPLQQLISLKLCFIPVFSKSA